MSGNGSGVGSKAPGDGWATKKRAQQDRAAPSLPKASRKVSKNCASERNARTDQRYLRFVRIREQVVAGEMSPDAGVAAIRRHVIALHGDGSYNWVIEELWRAHNMPSLIIEELDALLDFARKKYMDELKPAYRNKIKQIGSGQALTWWQERALEWNRRTPLVRHIEEIKAALPKHAAELKKKDESLAARAEAQRLACLAADKLVKEEKKQEALDAEAEESAGNDDEFKGEFGVVKESTEVSDYERRLFGETSR